MNPILVVKIGGVIDWVAKGTRIRRGTVLSVRTARRTGRRRIQVQVIPREEGDYAGQTSVRISRDVRVEEAEA